MSDPNLPRLPDDLARLFAAEGSAHEPDPSLVEHIREGVSRKLVLRHGGDGGGGDGNDTGGPADVGTKGASVASKAAATKLAIVAALGGLVVGGGAGYVTGVRTSVPPTPASEIAAPSAVVGVDAGGVGHEMPSSSNTPAVPSTPVAKGGSESSRPVAAPSMAVRGDLRRERELIDAAGAALRAGNPDQALADAERHAQRFPAGQLAEDREVLAVRALLALGRSAEARARAQRAKTRFPGGSLGGVMDALFAPKPGNDTKEK